MKKNKYKYNNLMNMSGQLLNDFFKEVMLFSSNFISDVNFLDIILDYGRLVDTNEKYVIIDAVMIVISSDVRIPLRDRKYIMDSMDKREYLETALKMLRSIKNNRADVIKKLVNNLKDSEKFARLLINKDDLYKNLLENEEFMKQDDKYDKLVDVIFPQLKNNQK